MKITFILPAIGKKKGTPYIKTWQTMEPLTMSTLKALTPSNVETEFFDDRFELINYDTNTDLVAISVEIYTARRSYRIAKRFMERGIPVVLGGWHVTLNPQEAQMQADTILVGNAESVWEQLVEDAGAGILKKRYDGATTFKPITVDRSIFKGKKYSKMAVIETGRGCSFDCEFCAITAFHKATYHRKSIESIVNDIQEAKKAGKTFFFFADDNIVADPSHAIELFKAIAPLKIRWTGQGSLTMAKNSELLHWMKKSGCKVILIGYESLEIENLKQMNKEWNSRLGDVRNMTDQIHKAGLNIYATFVFGFDYDSPDLFDRTAKFAKDAGFFLAAFNHLLPMPGTKLYARLLKEGRILKDKWWLDPEYRYGQVTLNPKSLSAEETAELCKTTRRKFYSLGSILKRSVDLLQRGVDPLIYFYFWYLNVQMGKEGEGKDGLPLGDNLDELPK